MKWLENITLNYPKKKSSCPFSRSVTKTEEIGENLWPKMGSKIGREFIDTKSGCQKLERSAQTVPAGG